MVVLNNPPVPGKVTRNNKSFVRFWPEDGYSSYGPVFSINTVDMKHHADFTMWHFRLGKKEIAPHRYIIIKARIPTVKKRRLHSLHIHVRDIKNEFSNSPIHEFKVLQNVLFKAFKMKKQGLKCFSK